MADTKDLKKLQDRIDQLETKSKERRTGIWLEVSEVQFDQGTLRVQLQGDRAHPKPVWWPVAEDLLGFGKEELDTYKQILREMDKKRLVLARLTCSHDEDHGLHCDALRFQSAELGSR